MAAELQTLQLATRRQWRTWLSRHRGSSPGVWFERHKAHTGVTSLPHEDLVHEALCFGWIDSLVKRLDDDRYAIKVMPRRPTSKWSAINRKRWAELDAAGQLAPAGRAAAWTFFRALPSRERRNYVVWTHVAKRPETRERRIRESIGLLTAGRKLGLK